MSNSQMKKKAIEIALEIESYFKKCEKNKKISNAINDNEVSSRSNRKTRKLSIKKIIIRNVFNVIINESQMNLKWQTAKTITKSSSKFEFSASSKSTSISRVQFITTASSVFLFEFKQQIKKNFNSSSKLHKKKRKTQSDFHHSRKFENINIEFFRYQQNRNTKKSSFFLCTITDERKLTIHQQQRFWIDKLRNRHNYEEKKKIKTTTIDDVFYRQQCRKINWNKFWKNLRQHNHWIYEHKIKRRTVMKSHSNDQFTQTRIKILQYNVNKSLNVMHSLFKKKNFFDYDILTIQKSWINIRKSTSHNFLRQHFHLIFSDISNKRTKICIYVSIRIFLNQ